MRVSMKSLLAFAILLTVGQTVYGEYDVNAYCTLVANGKKLASVENCETYYTCNNGKGVIGTCSTGLAFDKDTQNCRPKSDVKCYFGVNEPCIGQSNAFVPVPDTCNGYIYCKDNKEAGRGQCPLGQIFHRDQCVYGNCNDNINQGETNDGLTSVCQIMPDNYFFGSTKNCKTHQKCTAGVLTAGDCPGEFVFDVNLGKCNYQSGNMCSRVTGQDIQPDPAPTKKCEADSKNNKEADSTRCSTYFICDGTKWVSMSCGTGLFYSVPDKKCLSRQEATPISTCNRCEFSKKQFVNAVDPDCRKYQVCSNGAYKGSGECAIDSFFNEAAQGCFSDVSGLKTYSDSNGACKKDDNNTEPNECDATCEALEKDDCKPDDECNCGLTNDECGLCKGDVDATTFECAEDEDTCDCESLTATTCKDADEECNCGLKGTKCVVCAEGADADGKCKEEETPTKTCAEICGEETVEADCTAAITDDCTCEWVEEGDGECKEAA